MGPQASEKHTLELFTKEVTLTWNDNRTITEVLNRWYRLVQQRDKRGNHTQVGLPVLKICGTDILQSEFQRLGNRVWLNDNLICCFLKKYVQDMVPNVYCFESHFFTRLIEEEGDYN